MMPLEIATLTPVMKRGLRCRNYQLDLTRPKVMGILNLTPDSFYDGNKYMHLDAALQHAETMVAEGAAIIELGAESTRPQATQVTLQQELDRVLPVLEKLIHLVDVPLAIDTSKPEVMQAAYELGISFINDVRALTTPGALEMALKLDVPVCLMHMQNTPVNMQDAPSYANVVQEVKDFLRDRIQTCVINGKDPQQLVVDPGFCFGKTLEHNLQLLRQLQEFHILGCPVLVGMSRKSMLGQILNVPVDGRLYGSIAAAVIAYLKGATIIRVHDVKPTVQALQLASALVCDSN